jgi:hypothetical protein
MRTYTALWTIRSIANGNRVSEQTRTVAMKRRGRALYRAGLLLGLLFGAVVARVAILEPGGLSWPDVIGAMVAFLVPFMIGVACRYALTGN